MSTVVLSVNILMLLLNAFFLYRTFKLFPEEGLAAAVMLVLILIYGSGLVGDARLGLCVIYLMGALGAVELITNRRFFRSNEKKKRRDFFTPGIVLFLLSAVYATVAFHDGLLNNWDELAQWGKAANYMVDKNALPYGSGFDGAGVLVSATTFFHYFIAKPCSTVLRVIKEEQYYISNVLLWFSGALLPLAGIGWKDWKKCFAYAAVVFGSMTFLFIQPYYNIYCDQACAIWAGALIAWQMFGKKSRGSSALVLMILWNVGLFKSMIGPMFAAVAVLVMGICNFMPLGDNWKDRIVRLRMQSKIRQWVYAVSACILPVLGTVVWSLYVRENALARSGATVNQEGRLALTLQSAVQKTFVSVSQKESLGNVSYFTFFLFAALMSVLIYRFYLHDRLKQAGRWIYSLYLAGFGIYWVILIYAYMTAFGYADSIATGSINRYFSDYMMLGLIPLIFPVFVYAGEGKRYGSVRLNGLRKVVPTGILLAVCLLIGGDFAGRLTTWYLSKEAIYQIREDMENYAERLKKITGGEGKIYMICQSEDGYPVVAADYVMGLQLRREGMPYYFQDTDTPKDIAGLLETDIANFSEILEKEGYEYLWIYKKDDYFSEYLEENFHLDRIADDDVYRIEKVREGKYSLELLENIKDSDE